MHNILIVDDERVIADTLGVIFRSHGFHTCVAYSAEQALACARDFSPDLLLCDISMPGRDGLDLMADFDRELPHCKVLVLTGCYANLPRLQSSRAVPQDTLVLTKPCHPADLVRYAGELLAPPVLLPVPIASAADTRI